MKTLEISNEMMSLLEKLVADENKFYERTDTAFTPQSFVESLIQDYADKLKGM